MNAAFALRPLLAGLLLDAVLVGFLAAMVGSPV